MNIPVYPIKFTPILKEKVWGGAKLETLLGKASGTGKTGESWEVSAVPGSFSVVANGPLRGKDIDQLSQTYRETFLGKSIYERFGGEFPLLFKFIDAHEVLSVQLHPNDAIAKRRHNSFGKAEMWHIVQADSGAGLYLGFDRPMNRKQYLEHLQNNMLESVLHFERVLPGESFYIPPGKIHAIGKGVLLAEIQQTSDITYRVYDWNRPDINGNMRELHNDLALEAIDFENTHSGKIEAPIAAVAQLIETPYFSTVQLTVNGALERDLSQRDSFVTYMCVAGETQIEAGRNSEVLTMGQTVLIPAVCKKVKLIAQHAKLLEIFAP